MFQKIVLIVFYVAIALWAFGIAVPFLLPVIGLAALCLAIFQLIG